MESAGKVVIFVGLAAVLIGLLMVSGVFRNVPFGKLPGDIAVEREGFRFYMPLATMILISLALTGLSWLIGALRR
jgi:uncharacterized iron-regulated membrane protein